MNGGREDCQERLKKIRELWPRFLYELDRKHGETERNISDMDKILGLTKADHDRWIEKAERDAAG